MSRARNWCFTLNNPGNDQFDHILEHDDRIYAVCQLEQGEMGTLHIQGYIEFSKPIRFNALKRLEPRCHWEARKGSRDQARDYCMKEDGRIAGPWEYGQFEQECGKRNDIHSVAELVRGGTSIEEIAEQFPGTFVKYHKGFQALSFTLQKKRDWKTEVIVYWGDPGTGKSRKAHEENPGAYWKPVGDWWDGYNGQDVVIIDDFQGWIQYSKLLQLMDRYPMAVEVKGGTVQFLAKKIIFTSNLPWDQWYQSDRINQEAIRRRIDHIEHFTTAFGQ